MVFPAPLGLLTLSLCPEALLILMRVRTMFSPLRVMLSLTGFSPMIRAVMVFSGLATPVPEPHPARLMRVLFLNRPHPLSRLSILVLTRQGPRGVSSLPMRLTRCLLFLVHSPHLRRLVPVPSFGRGPLSSLGLRSS